MKLIENNWRLSKQVEYKGNLLIVPVWTNWIATDSDKTVMAFLNKPFCGYDWWESGIDDISIGQAEFEEGESWKDSLFYVGEEQ